MAVLVASGGGISTAFGRSGVRVESRGAVEKISLVGVGYGAAAAHAARAVEPVVSGNLVRYRRRRLVEWYRNGPLGLEQGFMLPRRLVSYGPGPLTLTLALGGSLLARSRDGDIVFVSHSGGVRLRYGELTVVDRTGRRLRSTLAVSDGRLLIRVWDRRARYPLSIDPLIEPGVKLVGDCIQSCSGPDGTGEINIVGESGTADFGTSVALSDDGSTALVGASGDNNLHGAAWVFTRSGSVWSQQGAKLIGDCTGSCSGPNGTGESGQGEFGVSVALSDDGNTALIGGQGDGEGAAWVFTRSGSVWSQQGTKLISDCVSACSGPNGTGGGGYFGLSVALSGDGDTALIGARGDRSDEGAAWVFTRSGSVWSQQGTKLVGDCVSACSGPNGTGANTSGEILGGLAFGTSVALSDSGDTALIGAPGDSSGAGAAWVFTRSGSVWSEQGTKLVGDCITCLLGPERHRRDQRCREWRRLVRGERRPVGRRRHRADRRAWGPQRRGRGLGVHAFGGSLEPVGRQARRRLHPRVLRTERHRRDRHGRVRHQRRSVQRWWHCLDWCVV